MSVFDLEKLAELVTSRMGPLLVEPRRCCRLRSPLSKCSLCKQICPRDAISFSRKGIGIADHCLECGLCAGVCPTGALGIQEPTEAVLLEKIRSLQAAGGTVAVGCRRQPELNPKGLSVPCLGSLSLAFFLAAQQLPRPVYLVLSAGKCAGCPVTGGREHCLDRLAEAETILETLGLTGGALRPVPEAPPLTVPKRKEAGDPSRRAFFRSLFAGAKQVPKAMVLSMLGEPAQEEKGLKAVAGVEIDRQKLFKEGLAARQDSPQELTQIKRPVLRSTCHFCRACTVLCPLGALKCGDDYRLTLATGRCTGCGLCADICMHGSLELVPGQVAGLYRAEPELLAQGIKKRCQACGQEMIVSEDKDNCFICEQRALLFDNH